MNELDNLLKHLQIDGDFDLFGQSWDSSPRSLEIFLLNCGHQGMLASTYACTRQPPGLNHLILANPLARMED